MDILENSLLYKIACRPNFLYKLLEELPIQIFSKSDDNKIRFDTCGHQSKAYTMDLSTLSYFNFRENSRGTLIDLIKDFSNKSKQTIINELTVAMYTCNELPIDLQIDNVEINSKFTLEFPEIYDEYALEDLPIITSKLFLEDNLWTTTQKKWGIRYSKDWNRIIIPVYQDGYLVGAIGRLNKYNLEDNECKYLPYLAYKKSRVLFGFDEYRDRIEKYKKVILVESEKSVMKASQFDFNCPVLAVGCSNISRHHIERLNMLGVESIVWCQDKGVEEIEVMRNNVRRLLKYANAEHIGYIDVDNCEELQDKECVFDLEDKEKCKEVLKKYYKKVVRDGGEKEENI